MPGATTKWLTKNPVLLFVKPEVGADSQVRVPADTEIQTDGVKISQQTEWGTFDYFAAEFKGQKGYVLSSQIEKV